MLWVILQLDKHIQPITGVALATISSCSFSSLPLNFLSKFYMNYTANEDKVSLYSIFDLQPLSG